MWNEWSRKLSQHKKYVAWLEFRNDKYLFHPDKFFFCSMEQKRKDEPPVKHAITICRTKKKANIYISDRSELKYKKLRLARFSIFTHNLINIRISSFACIFIFTYISIYWTHMSPWQIVKQVYMHKIFRESSPTRQFTSKLSRKAFMVTLNNANIVAV